jgi:hypothetical protein
MFKMRFFVLAALMLTLSTSARTALSQVVPRYQPARPTVSPYLNLFRRDAGPLPNYYSLVRPQLNQQAIDMELLQNQARQGAEIGAIRSGQMTATPTGKGSWFMQYGRQTYMMAPTAQATGPGIVRPPLTYSPAPPTVQVR